MSINYTKKIKDLFNQRSAIITPIRLKHGANKRCTDQQWAAYLDEIKPLQPVIDALSAELKKAYNQQHRQECALLHRCNTVK